MSTTAIKLQPADDTYKIVTITSGLPSSGTDDPDLDAIASLDSAQAGVIASDGSGWIRKTYSQVKTSLAITKGDIALGNVDNTSDALKPISDATQTALNGKQAAAPNLTSLAGIDATQSGVIANDGSGWIKKTYAQFKTALGLVKADVGLGNVDNTSDVNKPVSTATQTALDARSLRFIPQGAAKTASYSMASWHVAHYDTTAGAIVQPLPSSPITGDRVRGVLDAGTNAVSFTFGGNTISSISTATHTAELEYNGTTWEHASGWKSQGSLDARYRFFVSVKDAAFGAKGDGTTDDTAAIQAAINYCLYTAGTPKHLFIPFGIYKTTNVLHVGYGDNYKSILIEGETNYGDNAGTVLAAIVPTFNDRPGINIQGTRSTRIRNLAVIGVNYAWLNSNYNSIADRSVLANWMGPNISSSNNTQYAPYCGIAVDAYAGTQPTTHYPTVTYPSFTGLGTTQYGKAYSSGITLENVNVRGFCVGVAVQPGQVPDGSNGDFISLRDCDLSYNLVGYGDGHADARNINFDNSRAHFCHTSLDSLTYGNQHGSMSFNARGSSFDNCYRLLNVDIGGPSIQGAYAMRFEGCYGEAIYSIGNAFSGSARQTAGAAFEECKFQFTLLNSEYSPVYVYNAPGTDVFLRDVILQGGYGFHSFNATVIGQSLTLDKLIADAFPSNTPGQVAETYTCGLWATACPRMRVRPHRFVTYLGYEKAPITVDSEGLPIELDASAAAGTGQGFPIPWFVNQMSYGRSKCPVTDVAPLTFDRATYNLSSVSQSGSQYTFTVSQSFISDALGAAALTNSYQTYSVGKGDIVVDNTSGLTFFVVSVAFTGTTTATIAMQQLNGVKTTNGGSTWTTTGSLSSTTGTLTIYNARRVYPSAKRASFTATSASGAATLKQNGTEATVAFNFYPVGVGDYLISSALSQSATDSVFPQTKISAINQGNGSTTFDQNARRSYFGDAPLFVRGTL